MIGLLGLGLGLVACKGPDGDTDPPPAAYTVVGGSDRGAAVLSVGGTGPDDVWFCGADAGAGPLVLHWDGQGWGEWLTSSAGDSGDLWWVWAEGPRAWMVGAGGRLVIVDPEAPSITTEVIADPRYTLFGIWGSGPTDVWAVGGDVLGALPGIVLHHDGTAWTEAFVVPDREGSQRAAFKVWGRGPNDVTVVGTGALIARWDGATWTEVDPSPVYETSPLTTVSGDATRTVAVGGYGNAVVALDDGSGWVDDSPPPSDAVPYFNGVTARDGALFACGGQGSLYERTDGGWVPVGEPATLLDFHACWLDPSGRVWITGGDLISLDEGVIAVHGEPPDPIVLP